MSIANEDWIRSNVISHVAAVSYCSNCHSIRGLAMVHPAFCIFSRNISVNRQKKVFTHADAILSYCSTCHSIPVTCAAAAAAAAANTKRVLF